MEPAELQRVEAHLVRLRRSALPEACAVVLLIAPTMGQTWRLLSPPGPAPVGRWFHCSGFDPIRHRLVIVGGMGARLSLADAWEYDGARWILSAWPAGRLHAADMVFAAGWGRLVVFGGYGEDHYVATTWEHDGSRWVRRTTPSSPSPRGRHAMAYDQRRRCVVMFGGRDESAVFGDTWEYDGTNWTERAWPVAGPGPRYGHQLAYDAGRGCVVLFDGLGHGSAPDTWEYDGRAWVQVQTPNSPGPRQEGQMSFLPSLGVVVLAGGYADYRAVDDTWAYDGVDWIKLDVGAGPPARGALSLGLDAQGARLLLFGGFVAGASLNDLWEFTPPHVPAWSAYGLGCAGSAGVPSLVARAGSVPALGATFVLRAANLPARAGSAVLLQGLRFDTLGGRSLPLDLGVLGMPGCDLWLAPEPAISTLVAHGGNRVDLSMRIPADPRLAGLLFSSQVLTLDPAAPGGVGAVSNAGIATLY